MEHKEINFLQAGEVCACGHCDPAQFGEGLKATEAAIPGYVCKCRCHKECEAEKTGVKCRPPCKLCYGGEILTASAAPSTEVWREEAYLKVKPYVEKMKAKYPHELNLEGLEPALTSDIGEIVHEMLAQQKIEHCSEPACPACDLAAYERGREDARKETIKEIYQYASLYSDGSSTLLHNYLDKKYADILALLDPKSE